MNPAPLDVGTGSTRTVLLVDDDEAVLRLLTVFVTRAGYRPIAASNASIALDMLASDSVDAVVCDIRMPGRNGAWVIEHLGSAYPFVPVIIASGETELAPEISSGGNVAGHLTKPFTHKALRTLLDRILDEGDGSCREQCNLERHDQPKVGSPRLTTHDPRFTAHDSRPYGA